jgi:hypothetical protein
MRLSALLLSVYLVPAPAQGPNTPVVVIPREDFESIKQEFVNMRALIELQGKLIDKLRNRYDCT